MREALQKARIDDENRAPDSDGLKPGITLDLTQKNIPALPDEVVDILRNGVERLALSHNSLVSLPARFARCTSLRYLAARNNAFEVFPLPLCDLTSLEFLDLGRNKLKELPPEIAKLTSLKALALQDNRIKTLPLGLGDMSSLQRLRLDGNPISFPPKEVFVVQRRDLAPNETLSESVSELMLTDQIKKYLGQRLNAQAIGGTSESEAGDDESSEGADTPRLPARRPGSRFPIRVKGSGGAGALSPPVSRSPSLSRPPPIPGRSLSQYTNTLARKQGIIPLTMGKSNESLRSNPELVRSSLDEERSRSRSSARAGEAAAAGDRLAQQPGAVTTSARANRTSTHFRGFSYSGGLTLQNPFSPEDPSLQRPLYVRALSALPVRKYQSQAVDPVLEVSKGILYAIFQLHMGVQTLMSLTNDGGARRSSLEMVFYNTNVYFGELERAIQDYELSAGTRAGTREHEGMQRAYVTLIQAYVHICSRLTGSVDLLVDNGDQRYMRTFLLLVYHSVMELRATISTWLAAQTAAPTPHRPSPPPRETLPAPRPPVPPAVTPGRSPKRQMQVKTDIPYNVGITRRPVAHARTPPSSDSFSSSVSSVEAGRGREGESGGQQADPVSSDGDQQFECFFVSLKTASELIQETLPGLKNLFAGGLRKARSAEDTVSWELLLKRSAAVAQQEEPLRALLSTIRLRDPSLGARSPFWGLCHSLFVSWAELCDQIKLALDTKLIVRFPADTEMGIRQISRNIKDGMSLWDVVRRQAAASSLAATSSSARSGSPARKTEQALPLTPQSAALGPAVRATKPFSPP